MASNLDSNVERIFDSLRSHGLLDDSLVLVVSDNGGEASAGSSNYPLRGEKFTYFEGGIRVPAAVVNLPGEGRKVSPRIATMSDILPTILDAASVPIPSGVEGQSLLDVTECTDEDSRLTVLLDPVYSCGAVFSSQYKLVVNGTCGYDEILQKPSLGGWSKPGDADDNEPEVPLHSPEISLFDVSVDPYERHDLSFDESLAPLLRDLLDAFQSRKSEALHMERQSKAPGLPLSEIMPRPPNYKIRPIAANY